MRNKSTIFSTAILVIAFSTYWAAKYKKTEPQKETASLAENFQEGAQSPTESSDESAVSDIKATAGRGWAPGAGQSTESMKAWLAQESRVLDNPNSNSEAKQKEIATVAQNLTPEQASLLLETALSEKAPAGQKILATYLLVQGGARSETELSQFIRAPLKDHGPVDAHSEAESQSVRDKSLRIMAIDGLVSRARKDPKARDLLARSLESIQDAYVRSYVEKQIRQLQ